MIMQIPPKETVSFLLVSCVFLEQSNWDSVTCMQAVQIRFKSSLYYRETTRCLQVSPLNNRNVPVPTKLTGTKLYSFISCAQS